MQISEKKIICRLSSLSCFSAVLRRGLRGQTDVSDMKRESNGSTQCRHEKQTYILLLRASIGRPKCGTGEQRRNRAKHHCCRTLLEQNIFLKTNKQTNKQTNKDMNKLS